jgi:dTMP kinase
MERRGEEYHARVRAGFLAEARRRPERIRVIDAGGKIEAVQDAIRREVAPLLTTECH